MRNWHRWVMTVFGLLLVYWVISGLVIAIYDVTDQRQVWAIEGGGPGARLNDFAVTAAAIPAPVELATGIDAALAKSAGISIASVDLRRVGTALRLQLADASGERSSMVRYYADTGAPMTALVADGDPDANVPAYVTWRNTLKAWHRGNIAGFTGQFVGLFTGIALLVLSITGVLVYVQLWQARKRNGKPGFFWNTRDSLWRRLHRWISIVSAVLVINIAISGSILAYGEIQLNLFLQKGIGAAPYPRPSPLPAVSAAALPADIPGMLQRVYVAASKVTEPDTIAAIQLVNRDGQTKGLVTFSGAQPVTRAFDASSGAATTDWATAGVQVGNGYYADWHQILKRIHRGDIIGSFVGRYIDLLAGIALLYLVISGVVIYVQMLKRRSGMGRKGLFWQ